MSAKTADKDACLMEHFLSAETLDRIREFLDAPAAPKSRPSATKRGHRA